MEQQSTKLRVALIGYGAMGRELERLAPERNIDIVARFDSHNRFTAPREADFDVAIEFTRPDVAVDNIRSVLEAGRPIVVGTTGWLDRLDDVRRIVEHTQGRLIHSSNFSIGVNIFFRIVREAARRFNGAEMYDAAVHEIHHVRKADSPSGTALAIADILLDGLDRKRVVSAETSHGRIDPGTLHVTSSRLGTTVGTHIVTFDSEADTIELTHRAKNRSGFALGALVAAKRIMEHPPGIHRFEDII